MLVAVAFILFPGVASAEDTIPGDTVGAVRLSAVLVSALLAVFMPLLVGFATKCSDNWKGVLSLILNAVQAFIVSAMMQDGSAVFTKQALFTWLVATGASLVAYLNLWKPRGITSSLVTITDPNGTVVAKPGLLSDVGRK